MRRFSGMLGTGVNGNQASLTFVVNYSDGTSSTFVQSMSDWFAPQSLTSQSKAVTMAYRDTTAPDQGSPDVLFVRVFVHLKKVKMWHLHHFAEQRKNGCI